MGQKFSWLLHYFAYVITFPWWDHWFLFNVLAIAVSSVSTEPFIVYESITTCLKAIELFFQNIKKNMTCYYLFSADVSIFFNNYSSFYWKTFFLSFLNRWSPERHSPLIFLAFWEIPLHRHGHFVQLLRNVQNLGNEMKSCRGLKDFY